MGKFCGHSHCFDGSVDAENPEFTGKSQYTDGFSRHDVHYYANNWQIQWKSLSIWLHKS